MFCIFNVFLWYFLAFTVQKPLQQIPFHPLTEQLKIDHTLANAPLVGTRKKKGHSPVFLLKNVLYISLFLISPFPNNYLFENCGARRAFLRPYFFLSFIRESRVRNPALLRIGLKSASASFSARAIP